MIGSFIFQIIGASVVWILKGCQGRLDEEIAGPEDHGLKKNRNYIIALAVILIALLLANEFNRTNQNRAQRNTFHILQHNNK